MSIKSTHRKKSCNLHLPMLYLLNCKCMNTNVHRWSECTWDGHRIFQQAFLCKPPADGCSLSGRCNQCTLPHPHPLRNARYLRCVEGWERRLKCIKPAMQAHALHSWLVYFIVKWFFYIGSIGHITLTKVTLTNSNHGLVKFKAPGINPIHWTENIEKPQKHGANLWLYSFMSLTQTSLKHGNAMLHTVFLIMLTSTDTIISRILLFLSCTRYQMRRSLLSPPLSSYQIHLFLFLT